MRNNATNACSACPILGANHKRLRDMLPLERRAEARQASCVYRFAVFTFCRGPARFPRHLERYDPTSRVGVHGCMVLERVRGAAGTNPPPNGLGRRKLGCRVTVDSRARARPRQPDSVSPARPQLAHGRLRLKRRSLRSGVSGGGASPCKLRLARSLTSRNFARNWPLRVMPTESTPTP